MLRIREKERQIMKMIVIYDRIPEVPFLVFSRKGKPNQGLLYQYSKNYGFKEFGLDTKPHTRGGATTVYLVDGTDNTNWMLSGRTVCSMSDNFSYKEGRERALLRATNLGLGHDDLDSGLMFRLDNKFEKMDDKAKLLELESYFWRYKNRFISSPNTAYFNPETAKIIPEIAMFMVKTSKIILKNHVWIGFEE
jgi:hypothetical protein